MLTQLPYGLQNGKLISINDVESGLACNCICPACKSILVAKKGNYNIHHFAHHNNENCKGGIESALHLAAKNLILEQKTFTIPPLSTTIENRLNPIILSEKKNVQLDEVQLEVFMENFKPDVVAKIRDKNLIIEIAVTHFVDELKYEKIRQKGISAIEVDLRDLKDGFSPDDLKQLVIEETTNKSWIFNAREQELQKKHLHQQKVNYKQEYIKQKKIIEEYDKNFINKDHLTQQGFDKVTWHDGGCYCPKIIHEESKKLPSNNIMSLLQNGAIWNGKMYGKSPNGKFIFLNNKKRIVFPPDSNISKHELKKQKWIYSQLLSLSEKADVDYSDCENCNYFAAFIEDEESPKVLCKYRKENKLK